MPREGLATKHKLIRAGEQLFARQGIDGALARDIVAHAGQANDSAIQYHFGSRAGLLAAILAKHVQEMEAERQATLAGLGPNPRLATLVRAVVEPVAAKLQSDDGRDFLQIIAQLAGRAQDGIEPEPIRGTALSEQLAMLADACRARLPHAIADERITMMITTMTALLAERARRIGARRRVALDHDVYVANMVDMLTAMLRAPSPI